MTISKDFGANYLVTYSRKDSMKTLNHEQAQRFAKNILIFTAPALAIFFLQLSQGVDIKVAGTVALLALYGLIADYMKKLNK